jgi:hypothetical protein
MTDTLTPAELAELERITLMAEGFGKPEFMGDDIKAEVWKKLLAAARRGMESGWLPIESAPRDGSTILAYSSERPGYGIQYVYWSREGKKWHNAHSGYPLADGNKLTNWQARPAPPQPESST